LGPLGINRFAILLDGAFVIKKLQRALRCFPEAADIEAVCEQIKAHPTLADFALLRVYFYHAPPAKDTLVNPLDHARLNLATTPIYVRHESLIDRLELRPDFALRLGETVTHEWRLGTSAMKSLTRSPRPIQSSDLVPNISQKGVDLRIGLDIARLALREMVSTIVVVTGDSDLIPAFKFARREGIRLYLAHLAHGVSRELKAHTDLLLDLQLLQE
jgi:uncharacterized LabA/DUF88 family protein